MGAWIETDTVNGEVGEHLVAPYVGAWIETFEEWLAEDDGESHPTWVRGLKPSKLPFVDNPTVAPYVGAWIETPLNYVNPQIFASHPTWVRGLKHILPSCPWMFLRSHPTWVRGLKPAAFVERAAGGASHPTWVRGLKLFLRMLSVSIPGRTLRGCVD